MKLRRARLFYEWVWKVVMRTSPTKTLRSCSATLAQARAPVATDCRIRSQNREEVMRADTAVPTTPHECHCSYGDDDYSRLHRGTGFELVESTDIFTAKLYGAFAALLEKEIFKNEPPLLRLQWAIATPARYRAIKR